jgi:hypothetical protein
MPDTFANHGAGLESPAFDAAAVTPHDTNDLTFTARALYVGTGGDVAAILKGDAAAVTFKNVPAGSILPVAAKRVLATGTTAANILALW